MKRPILTVVALVAVMASIVVPAGADETAKRDVPALLAQAPNRFIPQPAGTTEDLSFVYGPFTIAPGQDRNLVTGDIPIANAHLTAVAPELVDVASGNIPTEQVAHIHHAHWFQATDDAGSRNCYASAGDACLAWVFGTGEEKTQGRFTDRADVEGETGPRYGIYIDGSKPQALIFMVHNKTNTTLNVIVVLDVTVIHGDAAQITAADPERPMHTVQGTLWGQTTDATADYPYLRARRTFAQAGTAIAAGGHLHPGGKASVITNLGPNAMCEGTDPDGDGYPGTTILNSKKYDRVESATPYSEDYQMGATKFGWRAPVHAGDVLAQYAPYAIDGDAVDNGLAGLANPATFSSALDGLDHAWFEAMTYTGLYLSRDEPPAALPDSTDPDVVCTTANFEPTLKGADTFEVQGLSENFPAGDPRIADLAARFETGPEMGMINHLWVGAPDPLCATYPTGCDNDVDLSNARRIDTDEIHIAGFFYAPGDLGIDDPFRTVAVVEQGTNLRFVNEDVAIGVRHSVTSCPLPCDGEYVANYPAPDGVFDSGKLGNLDYIDGGVDVEAAALFLAGQGEQTDTMPFWDLDTSTLDTGRYAYYCRLHPWMRGTFELV